MRNGLKTALESASDNLLRGSVSDLGSRVGQDEEAKVALETHLQEARQNAQAILKVVESLEHADSPDAAMLAALNSVREAFGWAYGTFWALDEKERVLYFTAEQTSAQAGVASSAAEQVSSNVHAVATGVEEMGASIKEIAKNATEAAKVAAVAVTVADKTDSTVAEYERGCCQYQRRGRGARPARGGASDTDLPVQV